MRNVAFLAVGMALLMLQANLFRAFDDLRPWLAGAIWIAAVAVDAARSIGQPHAPTGQPRVISGLRVELALPATAVAGHVLLRSLGYTHMGRPIPALVLPLILFMGVHEYALARGAAVAFVLGYATDVMGIAPVGLYTFTYVATYLLARAAGVRLAAQTAWMQVLLVGAFALLQSTMLLVLLAIFGRDAWVPRALYTLALPHALATAAVAPAVFRICEALHAGTAGATRPEIRSAAP